MDPSCLSNWYIDTVVQGTHFFGTPQSIRGVSTTVNGDAFTGSIEAGYPITAGAVAELRAADTGDLAARLVGPDAGADRDHLVRPRRRVHRARGRGVAGDFRRQRGVWQPYLKGNVWWGSNGFDTVTFNSFGIPTGRNGGTTLEGGGGVTGKLTRNVSVYGDASYLTSVSGSLHIALKGNVGLRVTW